MNIYKSTKTHFVYFLLLLTASVMTFTYNGVYKNYVLILEIAIVLISVLYILIRSKSAKKSLLCVGLLAIEIGIFATSFRYIRTLFSVPSIGTENIIGFSQYFGYPIAFDTFFCLISLFFMIITSILVEIYAKNK